MFNFWHFLHFLLYFVACFIITLFVENAFLIIFRYGFFFAPWFWDVEWWDFGGWEAGLFWRYVWWCIKSVTYLMIFAIGGPVITIIGVFFLYKNLGTKFGERSDERMYEETYGQPGYESGSE